MKKYLTFLASIIIFLTFLSIASSAQLQRFAFPFIGRWQPAEDPVLIDDYGFQDVQNLRKDGKRLKGVSGHTKINTSIIDSTYFKARNCFQFKKDNPAETHLLTQAYNTGLTASTIYQNTTAIPSQGDFSATAVHTDDSSGSLGRFSVAPQGQMLYCNGAESLIWGGTESYPISFMTSTAAVTNTLTNPRDFSNQVRNTLSTNDEVAIIGGGLDSSAVLLLHCDGTDAATTFTDSSTTPHTPTAPAPGDAQLDTAYAKFGSASGLLDGTGDFIEVPDNDDFNFGSGNFTVDGWYRFPSTQYPGDGEGAARNFPFWQIYDDDSNFMALYATDIGGTVYIYFKMYGAAITDFTLQSSEWTTVEHSTWFHVALVRNSSTWTIYIDGTSLGSDTSSETAPDYGGTFDVGYLEYGTDYGHVGWVDEVRVSKAVARWTTAFDPPVAPYYATSQYWLIGSPNPLQGVKYYVQDENTSTSTMTCKEWNGYSWNSLTITDNTSSGGISLAQTGTVTWDSTENTSKPRLIEGFMLYWYQFYLSAGHATVRTVTIDAPFQDIKDIWSTDPLPPVAFHVYDATNTLWEDYTLHVNTESTQAYSTDLFAADLSSLADTEYVYVGFTEQIAGIKVTMTSSANTNAATITVSYWNGATWVALSNVNDETDEGGDALAKSGYITWTPPAREEESTRNLFGLFVRPKSRPGAWRKEKDVPEYDRRRLYQAPKKSFTGFGDVQAYYYKLSWSAALDADVLIDTVTAVPALRDIKAYSFPAFFQERSFLFCENYAEKNKAIYSAFNTPFVWNGPDTGALYFGADEKLIASATLYNLHGMQGEDALIVTKNYETYRVLGDGPENWNVKRISENIGCIAPLSMASCETPKDGNRQVAIWQAAHGVVMCDGISIVTISDDISNYWDLNSSDFIPLARQDDSVGWYNPNLHVYKLLISSGAGQTTHNIELEYSLKYNEWTKIYRENGSGANPLQTGFQVRDTTGNIYTYGTTDEGYVYRLENGYTWDSTAIAQMVWTKDLLLDSQAPFFRHTTVEYFRLFHETKSTGDTEDIDITHYGDGTETTHGSNDQAVPIDVDMADDSINTQDCTLGPFLKHSFKFTANITSVADGMELIGLGLYYLPYDGVIE